MRPAHNERGGEQTHRALYALAALSPVARLPQVRDGYLARRRGRDSRYDDENSNGSGLYETQEHSAQQSMSNHNLNADQHPNPAGIRERATMFADSSRRIYGGLQLSPNYWQDFDRGLMLKCSPIYVLLRSAGLPDRPAYLIATLWSEDLRAVNTSCIDVQRVTAYDAAGVMRALMSYPLLYDYE